LSDGIVQTRLEPIDVSAAIHLVSNMNTLTLSAGSPRIWWTLINVFL